MYERGTDKELGRLIDELSQPAALKQLPNDFARANVRDAKRDYTLQTKKVSKC